MDLRNIPFNRQCMDAEMEINRQSYVTQEPPVFFGPMTSVHHPNILFGNAHNNVDPYHLPEHYDNFVPYGVTHFNSFHAPPANINFGASYMPPLPVNYGPTSQISSYGNYIVHGSAYQEHGINHFLDGAGCSHKRKTIESMHENSCYSNASTSTGISFMGSTETRHSSEAGLRDSCSSYGIPHHGEDGAIAFDESSSGSVRVGSDISGVNSAHGHNLINPLTQGSYHSGQTFLQRGPLWFNQLSSSNSIDGGGLGWGGPPPLVPFMHASSSNGVSLEIGSQGVQGPLETTANRSSTNFLHLPYSNAQHYGFPYPSPVHGSRSRNGNFGFHPQAPAPSNRVPSQSVCHPGPFQPTGFRIQWPHNAGVVPETTNPRLHNRPNLRVSAVDEVAIIDYGEAYGVGNYDHHRDMRLDIEDMSYEELLALGELIGNVNTGLPEGTIDSQLKTRKWASSLFINLEELPPEDHDTASCIICQDAYEDRDSIGTLNCGHEYHAECLKKWLLVKNICPICKSEALPGKRKDL
ncbi:hypothetical protein SAY86_006526 [Trapa natans]|uniref:RING-type E3 ubiquitin transferase n=1 Tax=Trapa natans TaxID=22666 RepID=A0AAN7QXP9_TRANT|nr:hypothetical protein SAY86_006526 [Trapa natans]